MEILMVMDPMHSADLQKVLILGNSRDQKQKEDFARG